MLCSCRRGDIQLDGLLRQKQSDYDSVNEIIGIGDSLLLREEGWTRRQEKWREATLFGADGVVAHEPRSTTGMHSENLRCERPPRLRRFGSFATFSYWRSHPSSVRRGLLA